jgi:hypothetical protein
MGTAPQKVFLFAGISSNLSYILKPELSPKEISRNWARLIQKIYEVDPLVCSRCQGSMWVIALIEDEDVIKKILKHSGLWDIKRKPSPCSDAPPIDVFPAHDQSPAPTAHDYLTNPDYPIEAYF